MKILFKEEQKFEQWWVKLLMISLAGVSAFLFYGAYVQNVHNRSFGTSPGPSWVLILVGLLILVMIYYLYIQWKLVTVITEKNITIKIRPFLHKEILWSDIGNAEIVNYGFIGGYGIRQGSKYGTVYNVSGTKGLYIKLLSGKKMVIGSIRIPELKRVLDRLNP